ncbi:MAG: sensor domain-containing diguanylate cyclase [Deltaproteobacteria bacterium]|nr:sensor domain-containing diguanylate cyclase [Deltaproteobacteria bacterium]
MFANLERHVLQIWGACFVVLLLSLGLYLLYHDLSSLIAEQRLLLERSVYTSSRLLPSTIVQNVVETKDSQSSNDSQLQDLLFRLQSDLRLNGSLSIVDLKSNPPVIAASTKAPFKKAMLYDGPRPQLLEKLSTTSLYFKDKNFWISSFAPLTSAQGETFALVTLESDSSPFIFRLFGYALHYILLAVGLITLGGIIYLGSVARSRRSLKVAQDSYFTLFKESTDGIFILDERGHIQKVNEGGALCFEQKESALRNVFIFDNSNQNFQFIELDSGKTILKEGIKEKQSFRSKAKLILRNHRIKYLSYSCSPMINSGKVTGVIVVFQDISQDVIREQELQHFQSQLKAENEQLQKQVITDPLTKCLNKFYLSHFLEARNLKWTAYEGCSMLLVDLDNFKLINDTQGHLAGDQLLQQFSTFLRGFFRKSDKIIRYGGDEFLILLPQTDMTLASRITNNMLEALKKTSSTMNNLTISVGVAQLELNDTGREWIERADAALYAAKNAGKNRWIAQPAKNLELEVLN